MQRRVQRWSIKTLSFLLWTLVAVGVGFVGERLLRPEDLTALLRIQNDAYNSVASFEPLGLAKRYLHMIRAEGGIGVVVEEPLSPSDPWCSGPMGSIMGESWRSTFGCDGRARVSYVVRNPEVPAMVKNAPWIWKPVYAVPAVIYEAVVQKSLAGTIAIIFQLLIGFSATLQLGLLALKGTTKFNLFFLIPMAIGTIVLGSIAAFVTWVLMLAGLFAFKSLTSFAVLCCGTAGVTFALYQFGVKALERGAERALKRMASEATPLFGRFVTRLYRGRPRA